MFRLERYAPDFPAFVGRTLTPGALLELNGTAGACVNILPTEEEKAPVLLSYYPNPFNDELTLELAPGKAVDYQLIDVVGRLRMQGMGSGKMRLSTRDLNSGIYYLIVNGQSAGKLVKR